MNKAQKTMFFLFGIIVSTICMCISGVAMIEHSFFAMIWFFVSIVGIAANIMAVYFTVFPNIKVRKNEMVNQDDANIKVRKYKMVNQDDANIQDEIGEHGSLADAACQETILVGVIMTILMMEKTNE